MEERARQGAAKSAVPGVPVPAPPPEDGAAPEREVVRPGRGRASLRRNTLFLSGGQLATWTMTAAWTLVVPRALGAGRMGLLVTAWSAASIFGVLLGLGARSYLVREIVAVPARAQPFMNAAITLRIMLIPLFVAAVIAYGRVVHFDGTEMVMLALASGATLLTLLAEPIRAVFQAKERMEYLAFGDLVGKSAQSGAGILVALLGLGTIGLSSVWMVAAGIVVVLSARWARPYARVSLRTDLALVRSVARRSIAYYATDLFFVIYLWIDTVMLGVLARPEVVGWYGVATRLFQTLMFVPTIMATAWLPRLVAAHHEGRDRFRREGRAPLEWVVLLSVPAAVGTAVLAGPAVHLLYGSTYAGAVPVLQILALTVPATYVNTMLAQLLIAQDRLPLWTWFMAGAAIVNPVLNVYLIRLFEAGHGNGALGAAWSLFITELVMMIGGLVLVGRTVAGARWFWRLPRIIVVAAAMWAVTDLSRSLGMVFAGFAGLVSFALFAFALGLPTREDARAAASGLRRHLARWSRPWRRAVPGSEPLEAEP